MRKETKRICALVCAVLVSGSLFAQEAGNGGGASGADRLAGSGAAETGGKMVLTMEKAVELAEKNSRTLKSSAIDLDIKERAAKYGWNILLPTVQASGTLNRTTDGDSTWNSVVSGVGQGASFASGSFIPQSDWESMAQSAGFEKNESLQWAAVGSLGVSWNFTVAYIAQIKAAKVSYESGKLSWEQTHRETITNIKKLFYALLLQQESLKIQQTTLNNARQRAEQAQTNFKNGSVPELSLLQAQVNYENTKPEVEKAEQAIRQQLDTFAFLIGIPVGTEIELEGKIDPVYVDVTTEELLSKYGTESLQIRSLKGSYEAAKLGVSALDLATYLPTLAVNYSYQPTLAPYGIDFDKWSEGDNWSDKGSFSVTLAWNITNMLPWSTNRQKAADSKAQLKQLSLNLEMLQENQKVEVRKAVDTLNQARDQIEAMDRNIQLAQRAYEMTARSYRNGTTELLDLRDSETQLNQAKLGLLNQKFNYLSALMDLENTLNKDLTAEYAAR